jgi:hypothetical protein
MLLNHRKARIKTERCYVEKKVDWRMRVMNYEDIQIAVHALPQNLHAAGVREHEC